jgi:hypothetical protein
VIPIDELVEIWIKAHKEAHDDDLSWWGPALANFRPTAEDDAILDDEDEHLDP